MGAWGSGTFEDDNAADWAEDFVDEPRRELLESTLRAAINPAEGYLEAPESSMAIAAAEVIAALRGVPHDSLPDELQDAIADNTIAADKELVELAIQAVTRIQTDSELKELWDEAEEEEARAWQASVQDLEERLRR